MVHLTDKCTVIDLITVSDYLESIGQLDNAGGFAYLGDLTRNTPSSANASTYAETIREKSVIRKMIGAAHEISDRGYNPNGESAIDLVGKAESILSKVSDSLIGSGKATDSNSIIKAVIDDMERQAASKSELLGIPTGIQDLDRKTLGLQDTDLIVLAARPSMGKTALMLNMIAANLDKNNILFSIEMPSEKIMKRLIASVGTVDYGQIQTTHLDDYGWASVSNAMEIIKKSNLEIIDDGNMTVAQMRIHCRRYVKRYGKINMISADYLQLLKGSNKENRTQEIGEVSRALKELAKEFNCPVLALSQLNRGLEQRADKRPINSDLRESGQIEQDADVIMFLYRDEVYNEQSADKGLAEIIVSKARDGELGMVGTIWQGRYQKFSQLNGQELTSHLAPVQTKKHSREFNPK
jgi:replicative DNA helicase